LAVAEPEVPPQDHVEHVEPTRIDEVLTLLLCFFWYLIVYYLPFTSAFCSMILGSCLLRTSLF